MKEFFKNFYVAALSIIPYTIIMNIGNITLLIINDKELSEFKYNLIKWYIPVTLLAFYTIYDHRNSIEKEEK